MSEVYGKEYYDHYDTDIGAVNYVECESIIGFLTSVAKKIVEVFHPASVLDAGCATGHLVAALRDCGVAAYGVDISEYAISNVREDIKPFCAVSSLTQALPPDFPQKYDLVVSIEVLEHLYAEEGRTAVHNLCLWSEAVLFCSTPDDFSDPTHLNVQQREYWAKMFAEEGFMDDISYRPTFLTYYASIFRKNNNWLRQVEDYERCFRGLETQLRRETMEWSRAIEEKEKLIKDQNALLERDKAQIHLCTEQFEQERDKLVEEARSAQSEAAELRQRLAESEGECLALNRGLVELRRAREELSLHWEQIQGERIALQGRLESLLEENARYAADLMQIKVQCDESLCRGQQLEQELAEAQYAYSVIANAGFWKITKPFRALFDFIKMLPSYFLLH